MMKKSKTQATARVVSLIAEKGQLFEDFTLSDMIYMGYEAGYRDGFHHSKKTSIL